MRMKLVPVAFKAQKRDGKLVWRMVICWMEGLSRPPENSQALILGSGSLLPRTLTQVRLASQRLPCSFPSAFPRVMAGQAEEQ